MTADDTDGAPVKALPEAIVRLAKRAVDAAYGRGSAAAIGFRPNAAIVNLYAPGAHLGLHQDGEEPAPDHLGLPPGRLSLTVRETGLEKG